MNAIISNRALYHAKQGDFAGFCVSVPFNVTEENLREVFDGIRDNMEYIAEETISWFNLVEYKEYIDNPESTLQQLNEVATIQTRMKLRRAAKRTSARRSRKRFMRRRIRKNQKQLARRAYGQVKTALRKRLTGGRPWSKLSLSTRIRIDDAISRRKGLVSRMVRNRIPKMAGQESKRLQRVRLNSSFEYSPLLRRLMEAKGDSNDSKNEERVTGQNKERQQKHREKRNSNVSSFISNLMVVKVNGKEKIIAKQSYVEGSHEVVVEAGKLQMGAAKALTNDDNFEQSPSSVTLFGLLKGASKEERKELRAQYKEHEKKENMEKTETPEPIIQPPPATGVPGYNATEFEPATEIASRLYESGNMEKALSLILPAQQAIRSGGAGAIILPEEAKALNDLTSILKKSGLNDYQIGLVLDKELFLSSADIAFKELRFDGKDRRVIPGIGHIDEYHIRHMAGKHFGVIPVYSGDDTSPKADMVLIRKIEGLDPDKHFEMMSLAYGIPGISKKDIAKYKEAIQYREKYLKANEGNTGYIGISIKTGSSRTMSGNLNGDAAAVIKQTIESLLQKGNTRLSQLGTDVWDRVMKINNDFESLRGNQGTIKTRGDFKQSLKSGDPVAEELKVNQDKINNMFQDFLQENPEFVQEMGLVSSRGDGKFDPSSPAYATHVLTSNTNGTESTISGLNDDWAQRMGGRLKARVAVKSGSDQDAANQEKGERFDKEVAKITSSALKSAEDTKGGSLTKRQIRDTNISTEISFRKDIRSVSESLKTIPKEELLNRYKPGGADENANKHNILTNGIEDKVYSLRLVLSMFLNKQRKARVPKTPKNLTSSFSYNPLLKFLVEQGEDISGQTEDEEDEEPSSITDEEIQEYIKMAKDSVGDNFSKLLEFAELQPNIISYNDIDLHEFRDKKSSGPVNIIYINNKQIEVPVDQDVDPDKLGISDHYINIGKTFLAEAKKRNYRKEYDNYQGTKEQIANRTKRVLARRILAKMGRVHKGDGKDVDHKDGNPQNNSPKNLRAIDKSTNRAKH